MSQYTEEHFDEDHRDAHLEHVHMDFAARESFELRQSCWDQWIADLEMYLGHSMDGDQTQDGYSMDYAHDAFNAGYTAGDYEKKVRESKLRATKNRRNPMQMPDMQPTPAKENRKVNPEDYR